MRGYASKNPKLEFRRESFGLFEELLENIRLEATRFLSRVEIEVNDAEELQQLKKESRKEVSRTKETESAFQNQGSETPSQPQAPEQGEQGNRRLRRYEAKMARKRGKK